MGRRLCSSGQNKPAAWMKELALRMLGGKREVFQKYLASFCLPVAFSGGRKVLIGYAFINVAFILDQFSNSLLVNLKSVCLDFVFVSFR